MTSNPWMTLWDEDRPSALVAYRVWATIRADAGFDQYMVGQLAPRLATFRFTHQLVQYDWDDQ